MSNIYIPLIKETEWIDLSSEHRNLRIYYLEQTVRDACVERRPVQPLMLQGAFGIGKSTCLYYMFHYAWCICKVPAFIVQLDRLVNKLETITEANSRKIRNDEIGPLLSAILNEQIQELSGDNWGSTGDIYFENYENGDLNSYIKDFSNLKLTTFNENNTQNIEEFPCFSVDVIKAAIDSKNRPLLLVDEFEAKYYKLKNLIEDSGGGYLRKLFDQIVQEPDLVNFQLVIGNGPASGYEVARENESTGLESDTASSRRINSQSIPFPTVSLLKSSFITNEDRGYINFIWWLSRCRPGHVKKLHDNLKSSQKLSIQRYTEFVNRDIFKEPIDESGESVAYYKTRYFDDISGSLETTIMLNMLSSFKPNLENVTELRQELKECDTFFFCSTRLVSADRIIIPNLKEDILKFKRDNESKQEYSEVTWNEFIGRYLGYILEGISDSDGNIAFGMVNDEKAQSKFAEIFVLPILELTYDFISMFQDESILNVRQSLDLLLAITNNVRKEISNTRPDITVYFPKTYSVFETTLISNHPEVYLQLSLYSIQESIEQPIGSPKLKYKGTDISQMFGESIDISKSSLVIYSHEDFDIIFVPSFGLEKIQKYLDKLISYLFSDFHSKYQLNGKKQLRVIYFEDSAAIEGFKEWTFKDADGKVESAYLLKKVDVVKFDKYEFTFGAQIRDFLDSVTAIGILGTSYKELSPSEQIKEIDIIKIEDIIKQISSRNWENKKENIRTIEHYKKIVFNGSNSIISQIMTNSLQEYLHKVEEYLGSKENRKEYLEVFNYFDEIYNSGEFEYDEFTSLVFLTLIIEDGEISEEVSELIRMLPVEVDETEFEDSYHPKIKLKDLKKLMDNSSFLKIHRNHYNPESSFIESLESFINLVDIMDTEYESLSGFLNYLKDKEQESTLSDYHTVLGGAINSYPLTLALKHLNILKQNPYDGIFEQVFGEITKISGKSRYLTTIITDEIEKLNDIMSEDFSAVRIQGDIATIRKLCDKAKIILESRPPISRVFLLHIVFLSIDNILQKWEGNSETLIGIHKTIVSYEEDVENYEEKVLSIVEDKFINKVIEVNLSSNKQLDSIWTNDFIANFKLSDSWKTIKLRLKKAFTLKDRKEIGVNELDNIKEDLKNIYENCSNIWEESLQKYEEIASDAEALQTINSYIQKLLEGSNNEN